MEFDMFSPYIRFASMHSTLIAPFKINERVIFDFELIYIEKGMWNINISGKNFICRENDVILIPPNTPHIITSIDNITVVQPHIHFDVIYDDKSRDVYVSFINKNQMTEEEKLMIRKNVLCELPIPILKISDLKYFKLIFYDCIDSYIRKGRFFQLECKEKMLRLLKYIYKENTQIYFKNVSDEKVIICIKDYIDQNYHNIITLEKLERQFSYDKSYISRMFTKKYSQSIIRYYNSLRIEAAKRYLLEGKSVTDISDRLNFSSVYSFSRSFKAHTNFAPSKYHANGK